jgi:hypothetical protein
MRLRATNYTFAAMGKEGFTAQITAKKIIS